MTDKAWKPKRVGGSAPESSSKEYLVELSMPSSEGKTGLEKILSQTG